MTPSTGTEPGTHWWKASALTTAPTLLPSDCWSGISITTDNQNDINRTFSSSFNTLNKLVNKHAPLRPVSNQQANRFMKPWITKGLRKFIKIKAWFPYDRPDRPDRPSRFHKFRDDCWFPYDSLDRFKD